MNPYSSYFGILNKGKGTEMEGNISPSFPPFFLFNSPQNEREKKEREDFL